MKMITFATAAVLALSTPAFAKITTGTSVADMTVVDSNGASHNLSDFAGKRVVLEWTNEGCPYVKKHYNSNNMQDLQRDATADGAVWLAVISSVPGKQGHKDNVQVVNWTAQHDVAATAVILDEEGTLGHAFSARTTPHMYIIDEDQTLVYQGAIDDNSSSNPATIDGATNYVREALASLDAGEAVAVTDTQPYGCSVKYSR
ncbi:thioredoxin family protein [Algimonas arctica]|uniref:Thioredoxin family protein n=1 Tax=Algimonas arctica TaxID=1479486 RepID=A0A8J3CU93_9PROT|nr:redoxin domain-containing protein [Algimonas arctica]GHB02822.1 thioredoxin family protein [Algimonas arctica]